MYKVIIVDDEPMVREGLRASLEWDLYGLEIAGEASNGNEALSLVQAVNPHIIITDIKMPIMDGIEFIEQLKNYEINTKIIILSGYSDYKYLKQAIKLGVESYLLKPIDNEELSSLLVSTISNIEDELNYGIKQKEGLELLKNNTLVRLVTNNISINEFKEKSEFLDLKIFGNEFFVVTAIIEDNGSKKIDIATKSQIRNKCEDIINQKKIGIVFSETEDKSIFILNNSFNKLEYDYINKCLEELQSKIFETFGVILIIGIGNSVKEIKVLCESYNESVKCVNYGIVMNKSIVFNSDIMFNDFDNISIINIDYKELENYITINQGEELFNYISGCFSLISKNKYITLENLRNQIIRIVFFIINKIHEENGESINYIIDELKFDYETLQSIRKINEFEEFLKALCDKVMIFLFNDINKKISKIVSEALNYIKHNYSKDITLKDISNKLYINSAYLGQVFKKELGQSFTDYVNNLRIKKAKELLVSSNMKVYEIAECVGFTDAHYFLKMFKKYSGVNPSDIRKVNNKFQ